MKFMLSVIAACICFIGKSQEPEIEPYQEVGFLGIFKTSDFEEAHKIAEEACKNLGIEFRDNHYYDEALGLNDSTICGCGESHGYFPRGRFDDGVYVSIELSSSYEALKVTEFKYVVIVNSQVTSEEIEENDHLMLDIMHFYPDSFYFTSDMYIGCMH